MKNEKFCPKSLSIVIVDDDQVDVKAIKRGFSKAGLDCPVHCAKDGMEALAVLRGEDGNPPLLGKPLLLLVDINMPRMGGVEFIKEMHECENNESCSIFILTTAKKAEEIQSTYNFDITGYIVKEDIESEIDRLITSLKSSS